MAGARGQDASEGDCTCFTAQDKEQTSDPNKKHIDHVVPIDASRRNLTKQVIREAIVNAFKGNNSYPCSEKHRESHHQHIGHQNMAFLSDEPSTEVSKCIILYCTVSYCTHCEKHCMLILYTYYSLHRVTYPCFTAVNVSEVKI